MPSVSDQTDQFEALVDGQDVVFGLGESPGMADAIHQQRFDVVNNKRLVYSEDPQIGRRRGRLQRRVVHFGNLLHGRRLPSDLFLQQRNAGRNLGRDELDGPNHPQSNWCRK